MTAAGRSAQRTFLLAVLIAACAACSPQAPEPTATPVPAPTSTSTFPFPTLVPSPTEAPPSTPVPPPEVAAGAGETLYRTSFEEAGEWPLDRDSLGATSLLDGRLSVVVTTAHSTRIVASPAPPARDFVLQATFSPQVCSGEDEYGLVFRRAPEGAHLRFTVTCSGSVRARRVTQDGSRAVVPFVNQHAAVIPGAPASNRLAVRAIGDLVRLYVNDIQVLSFSDPAPGAGHSGVVVTGDREGQTTLLVDQYILSQLAPTPTLDVTAQTEAPDG